MATEEHRPKTNNSSSSEDAANDNESASPKKQPSKLKQIWDKIGLDFPTVITMIKAGLAPTIAMAMYQSDAVAGYYSTLGYLVQVMSILGMAILPRAKFFQTITMNIISICLASAINLLGMWSALQARLHTTPSHAIPAGYNAAASAVSGIWFFFLIYTVNTLRSFRPQLQFPSIVFQIFTVVSEVYGPHFTSTAEILSFMKRLLTAFLTGFGLATGVHIFFFPVTVRKIVFKELTAAIQTMRAFTKAHTEYIASLEKWTSPNKPFHDLEKDDNTEESEANEKDEADAATAGNPSPSSNPEATQVKKLMETITMLHGKLHADIPVAAGEMAYGKLNGEELTEIFRRLRQITLTMIGLSSIVDLFRRVSESHGWNKPRGEMDKKTKESKDEVEKELQRIMHSLHEPFQKLSQEMDKAFEHVLLVLQFITPPKKQAGTSNDLEAGGGEKSIPSPGDTNFAVHFEQNTNEFFERRNRSLKIWFEEKGIEFPSTGYGVHQADEHEQDKINPFVGPEEQRQLFFMLYMEYLLWSASEALLALIKYADSKVSDGTLSKKRLITPKKSHFARFLEYVTKPEDSSNDGHYVMATMEETGDVYLGEAFSKSKKNPEHLPAENVFERIGEALQKIPEILRSGHSVFGFRVATASISVALIAFLRNTSTFFLEQRLLWALIMVSISMTRTAGQSVFNFILRVLGTLFAMIFALVAYYIVDGKTPGVIIFTGLVVSMAFYVVIKFPRYTVIGIISGVTTVLINGYELQVRKIGIELATSNGQPYYPVYLLGPYRLATVAAGIFVSFIFTIFPYPVTEYSELRSSLGSALYLLSKYYALVHETVKCRIKGMEGNLDNPDSPGRMLETARNEVFAKQMLLLQRIQDTSRFSKWQINIGGKFPAETYDAITHHIENILSYAALVAFASSSYSPKEKPGGEQWLEDFKRLVNYVQPTSHEVTSIFALLSASVANGHPLPPFLQMPRPFALLEKLQALDKDILSIRHIEEPGYAAFAVIQIASRTIAADMANVHSHIKYLVGELDFSLHIVAGSREDAKSGTKGKKD